MRIKENSLKITVDDSNQILLHFGCENEAGQDIRAQVGNKLCEQNQLDYAPETWLNVHDHFEVWVQSPEKGKGLVVRPINLQEGLYQKGNIFAPVPAILFKLELLDEDEFKKMNAFINNHPEIKKFTEEADLLLSTIKRRT